jgi:hypothetical protein
MFSVVIPTMWKSMRLLGMLHRLYESDYVDEIILIDNDKNLRFSFENKKIRLLEQDENIFVNPAWNLGVEESKNQNICILNDDVTFNVDEVFNAANRVLSDHPSSCLGVHPASYKGYNDSIKVAEGNAIGQGWGCCIFLRKENWVDIPEQLKIWFGDNWIVRNHEKSFSAAFRIFTEMSTTSGLGELSDVIKQDVEEWSNINSYSFSIGYIDHDADVFDRFLGPSLNKLNGDFEVVCTSDEKRPAENYNKIIDNSESDFIILTHQDVSFSSDLLERISSTINSVGVWSALAMVGVSYDGVYRWSNQNRSFELSSADCCFIVINKSHGIRFDENTFDDFHLYVEDYCAQARKKTGFPVRTILTNSRDSSPDQRDESLTTYLNHHSVTINKRGFAWGKYKEYRKKLQNKWPGIKTT